MTNTTKPALSAAPVAQEPVAWQFLTRAGKWVDCEKPDPEDFNKMGVRFRGLYTSPPATPAGVGVDEIARIIEDNCSVRVQGEYHAPHEGLNEAATAILALLSRGSGSDQQRSHEEQSTQNI